MAEDWEKYLKKCTAKDRQAIESIIISLLTNDWENLNVKPLKGAKNIGLFRCRVGKFRIIFSTKQEPVVILGIGPRGDIYKKL